MLAGKRGNKKIFDVDVPEVDIDISKPNGYPVDEDKEETDGGYVAVGGNLKAIYIRKVEPSTRFGNAGVQILYGGNITIWNDMSKTTKINSGDIMHNIPTTVYVEGISPGTTYIRAQYTPPSGNGTAEDKVKVTVLSVELISVSGEDENGQAKVLGMMTPSAEWASTRILVNGIEKSSWSGSFTAGNFQTWIDQNWFSADDNTLTYEITTASGCVCSDTITATRNDIMITGNDPYYKPYTWGDSSGGGLAPVSADMKLKETYRKVTYSIPYSGRIVHLYESDLGIHNISDHPDGYSGADAIITSAIHEFIKTDGSTLYNMGMVTESDTVIIAPNTRLLEVKTAKWINSSDYADINYGKATVIIGWWEGGGWVLPVPWPSFQDNDVEAPDQPLQ